MSAEPKRIALSELPGLLAQAREVFLPGCAAELTELAQLIPAAADAFRQPVIFGGIFVPGVNAIDYAALADNIYQRAFFMTPAIAASYAAGKVLYCPWRYRMIDQWYRQGAGADTVVVMLSAPNADGFCSLGITTDFAPGMFARAKTVIGIVNEAMPAVCGDSGIHLSKLDYLIEMNRPLYAREPAVLDELSLAMGRHAASFVEDGDTVQLGLGNAIASVAAALSSHRGLAVRSGLIEDSLLGLEQAGALDPARKIQTGVAIGSQAFYDYLADNERFSFEPVQRLHSATDIAQKDHIVTFNSALEIDLLGQVNSYVTPRGYMSGPGGLPEFVQGALSAANGRSVIVLPSVAGKAQLSKVVAQLKPGVSPSLTAADADVFVTEHGAADVRGLTVEQRAEAIIAIAAPAHRQALSEQWAALRAGG